jgi:hypothetical protein
MKNIGNNLAIALLASNVLLLIAIILLKDHLPPVVPLFFGSAPEEAHLAPVTNLFIPPAIAIAILLLNFVISHLFRKDKFLQQILFGFTIATTALSTITVVKIILLVGNI